MFSYMKREPGFYRQVAALAAYMQARLTPEGDVAKA